MQQVYSKLVLSGFVAVDTFFLLSGLFVAWSLLRGLDNGLAIAKLTILISLTSTPYIVFVKPERDA